MANKQNQNTIRLDALARKIIHKGLMTSTEVTELATLAQKGSESFATYIEHHHVLPDEKLLTLKSEVYGVAVIDVFDIEITTEALELIP